jgi:hypothetical protein
MRPPPPPPRLSSSSQHSSRSQPSRQAFPVATNTTASRYQTQRPSSWESIDPSTIEVVDLTDPSPLRSHRRPLDSPASDRPVKRAKGKDPEVYISLDDDDNDEDDDDEDQSPASSEPPVRHKSPSQSGSLSQAKCVICLDPPTDLVATPCGMSPTTFYF